MKYEATTVNGMLSMSCHNPHFGKITIRCRRHEHCQNVVLAAQDLLQSWGYMRVNSTQCGEQMTGDLPMDFFVSAWQTYDG